TLHDLEPTAPPANGFLHPSPPGPPVSSNGSPTASRHIPSSAAGKRSYRPYWIAGFVILGCIRADVGPHYLPCKRVVTGLILPPSSVARVDVLTHKVKKEPLVVTVTEKGTLESMENHDITCRVRAGNKGFATTINEVIDDGTRVKRGDKLM